MKAQPSQKLLEELGSEILPPEYGGSGMSVKVDIVDIRYCTSVYIFILKSGVILILFW